MSEKQPVLLFAMCADRARISGHKIVINYKSSILTCPAIEKSLFCITLNEKDPIHPVLSVHYITIRKASTCRLG